MLPIDHLRAVRKRGEIRPLYLEDLTLPERVLSAARASSTVGEFRRALASIRGEQKLVAGLGHLVEQTCEKEEVDYRKVARIRLEIFKAASTRGFPLSEKDRAEILSQAASKLGLDVDALLEAFGKAYEENRRILKPPEITPGELMAIYNLALIQTLLFKSLYVKAWLPNDPLLIKNLIRAVKGFRLMYIAEESRGGILFHFDGPVSAVKQTERYGTRLAKLMPYITSAEKWEIEAEVKIGERTYRFRETWRTAPPLPKTPPQGEQFDSSLEQEFYRQISRFCQVEREPEAIVVDGRVYIPDFRIGELYVEIVGFWTPDYLRRKFEKLAKAGKPHLILVNEELAMATWKQVMPSVVIFKGRPRLSDVYKYVKPYCISNNCRE